MPPRIERIIFIAHGIVTLAAGIVLALFPAAIPATVGIAIGPEEYLLSYFLGAAELGIGALSLGAARLDDRRAIRLVAASFAVFHGATAILEVVHLLMEGADAVLIVNLVVRLIVTGLFLFIARSR